MGGIVKAIVGGPDLPKPKPVIPMPDPQGPEAEAARRRTMIEAQNRQGRASTLLSGDLDYSRNKLGTR